MCRITAITSGKARKRERRCFGGESGIVSGDERIKSTAHRHEQADFRNIDICLGLENQIVYDIADVVNGICTIKKALIRDRRFFGSLTFFQHLSISEKAQIRPAHTNETV